MPYSLDSVYKAAEQTRARREAEEAAEREELAATLRLWKAPSFDPKPERLERMPLPTVEEVEAIRAEAYKIGSEAGYAEGHQTGRDEGLSSGHKEGFAAGHAEGYEAGYEKAKTEIEQLTQALDVLTSAIAEFPAAMKEPLHELAYAIGERLSGQEGMDPTPFIAAVQEALMRLPKPGESMFFRVRPEEQQSWRKALDPNSLPFTCTVLADDTLPQGHAYVEALGMRLNIGIEARRALVKTALGLPLSAPDASEH